MLTHQQSITRHRPNKINARDSWTVHAHVDALANNALRCIHGISNIPRQVSSVHERNAATQTKLGENIEGKDGSTQKASSDIRSLAEEIHNLALAYTVDEKISAALSRNAPGLMATKGTL